ncbi:MAG: hypothetical protein NVS9B10_22630 [Nevskia sp.]
MLGACGGGSAGSGTPPPAPPPVNQAPTANAGPSQTVVAGASVSLPGSGADSDGTIVSYAWAQTAGPTVTLNNAATATASFTAPAVTASTALTFRLTVTDNQGATGSSTVTVTVTPAAAAGNVTITGAISYDRVPHNGSSNALDYNLVAPAPARGVTVQAIDNGTQAVLASTVTDASNSASAGSYSLSVPANTVVYIRVRAEMLKTGAAPTWNFTVVDNTAGNALYTLAGAPASSGAANSVRNLRAASGFDSSGTVTGARAAAPFAILDSVFAAFSRVTSVDATIAFPALAVGWSGNNVPASSTAPPGSQVCPADGMIGTSYYSRQNICLLGSADNDTDEYDDHVIIHEWGHYFEDQFSRADNIGGGHSLGDRLDLRVAFGEGFGNAYSGMATDDPFYRDSFGSKQSRGFAINVESDNNTNPGWYSEGSVGSILYDLYDATNDGADTLTLGFAPIYQVLRNAQRTGVPLTSIFSFITALKQANPGSAAGIDAIVNAQSINSTNIDAYGSNETNNAGDPSDVLPIYTALTLNAAATTVCSIKSFGETNKLSVRRFFRFSLGATTTVTFRATGGTDPDLYLYRAGLIGRGTSSAVGSEVFSQPLTAGQYVLEVLEFLNADGNTATGGRSCIAVDITG